MSDEVPQSTPQQHQPAGAGPTSPHVSLDKRPEERTAWPAGEQYAASAPARHTTPASAQGTAPAPERWTGSGTSWSVPGQGTAPAAGPGRDAMSESRPEAVPSDDAGPYRQTVTSPPGTPGEPFDAGPSVWAPPVTGSATPAANSYAPRTAPPAAGPYAPPAAPAGPYAPPAAPAGPYAPPAAPANPYAPSAAPANPYAPPSAQHAGPEPVPPPPIAPDGPGQVPYGYPGAPSYGYPGQPQPPYAGPYPAPHGYGWPGMQPMPSNGMGTASLVLGILAVAGFVAWPLAIVLGTLALVFGALGRGKAKRGEATNPGMALAGLICGASGIVLALVFLAFIIAGNT